MLTWITKNINLFYHFVMNEKEILAKIVENIRIERLRKKLTQEKLAEEVGITQKYVNLIENGKANPSIIIVVKICNALKIDLNSLLN